jgi:ABC-2 type transport system permease protein
MTILRSEARKAMTTSTIWWILLAAMVIVALGTYLTVALGDTEGQALLSDDALREAIHGASGGSVLKAVAGVIGVAGEWRTGQANQTFMSTPRRERVLAAKAAVYTGVGLIFGVVASLVALPIAWAVYRAEGVTFPLDNAVVWTSLGVALAAAVLLGLLGVGVGAILRNQVLGIVVTLGWFFLLEPIIGSASSAVGKWFPGSASSALAAFPGDDQLSVGAAAAVLASAALLLLMLGTAKLRSADVAA